MYVLNQPERAVSLQILYESNGPDWIIVFLQFPVFGISGKYYVLRHNNFVDEVSTLTYSQSFNKQDNNQSKW